MNEHKDENDEVKWDLAEIVTKKRLKDDYPQEMHRTLHLIKQHDLVGAMITRAMENGDFDHLEGTGKPLNLYENPFEPVELRMVHKILKDAGYAPDWIELNKEIGALQEKLDKEIKDFKTYTQIVFREKRSGWAIRNYERKKKDFYIQLREKLNILSKKILDFNLSCPLQMGRTNINIENEIARIAEEIEDLTKSSNV